MLSAINDPANWIGSETTLYAPACTFSPPLPVELVSFDAVTTGEKAVLRWATASETNNAGFDVERRVGSAWNRLGFVGGHGTTAEAQRYEFVATALTPGTHTFRLKQIDFDGGFAYSPEVEVYVQGDGASLARAFPNPFSGQTHVSLGLASAQHVRVRVFDVLGRAVATLADAPLEAGTHALTFDGGGLPAGLYVIRAEGERFAASQHVTLVR